MKYKTTYSYALFPFILVIYEIANYLSNDMYLPALPLITSDLHTSTHLTQQTLTAWFLGAASLQLFIGPLSDQFGRKPVLLGGSLIFILSTLICAITSDINILITARFFQGGATCVIVPAGYATIHELFDQIKAIQILALMGSIAVIAPAFGPLLGSIVLEWLSWRWIFVILFLWSLSTSVILWIIMPESNPPEKRKPHNWNVLLKNYFNILTNRVFFLNTLMFSFTFLGMITWITAGPFLVITTFKLSALIFGILQVMVFGSLIFANLVVKVFVERVGPHRLITIGLWITALGAIIAFVVTYLLPHFLLGLIIGLMIFTFGSSLAFTPSHRIAVEACSEPMGARMAVFSTLMTSTGFIGSLVSLSYSGTLFWFGTLLLIVAVLACLTRLFIV